MVSVQLLVTTSSMVELESSLLANDVSGACRICSGGTDPAEPNGVALSNIARSDNEVQACFRLRRFHTILARNIQISLQAASRVGLRASALVVGKEEYHAAVG